MVQSINSKLRDDQVVVSFFVPCFNEENNILKTIETIINGIGSINHEILIVDDNSTDKTKEIIEKYIEANPSEPIKLTLRTVKRGLGYNYFQKAHDANGKYYMLVNGDNVEPAEAIRAIVAKGGEADMVIPNFGKADSRAWNRRLLSWLFTNIVNLISGNKIKYYNGPVLHLTENVQKWQSKTVGFGYQAELLCKLLAEGKSYVQVTVPNGDREWGTSKAFSPSNFYSVANSLLHIFTRRFF